MLNAARITTVDEAVEAEDMAAEEMVMNTRGAPKGEAKKNNTRQVDQVTTNGDDEAANTNAIVPYQGNNTNANDRAEQGRGGRAGSAFGRGAYGRGYSLPKRCLSKVVSSIPQAFFRRIYVGISMKRWLILKFPRGLSGEFGRQ